MYTTETLALKIIVYTCGSVRGNAAYTFDMSSWLISGEYKILNLVFVCQHEQVNLRALAE